MIVCAVCGNTKKEVVGEWFMHQHQWVSWKGVTYVLKPAAGRTNDEGGA